MTTDNENQAASDLSVSAGSQSLDLFETWEQYVNVRVKGYTLRDYTSIMTLTFPPSDRKPSDDQIATITECLKSGWVISAIHFENHEDYTPQHTI
jgi:hypothetical protein